MKTNKGFSLVELIVVIAIMAVIAAVAVPVYNVYIDKANKASDMDLIANIEKVLTYAGYDGAFNDEKGGVLVLSTNGIANAADIANDSALDVALKNAFGEDYKTSLKLSYDGWSNSGLADGLNAMKATFVKDSSYLSGDRVDSLLGDVEKMTGMAQNLVTSLNSGAGLSGTSLSDLFTADVLNETGKKYGILEEDETWTAAQWDTWGADPDNKVAYGNLLVLAAADDIENNESTGDFAPATNLIMEFSSYYAFAAKNPAFSTVLDQKLEELQSVNGASAGKAWYDDLQATANSYGYDTYVAGKNQSDFDAGTVTDYDRDFIAFGTLMSGLGNPTDSQADLLAKDLNNANLFTDGVGNDMYNDYLDAVEAVSAMETFDGLTVADGCIAIMYSYTDNGMVIFNSIPTGK